MNVALRMAFFAEVTANDFERLRYIFILMDDDDTLCKSLWESNCFLRLLQSAYWGNRASVSTCDTGQVPYPVSPEYQTLPSGKVSREIFYIIHTQQLHSRDWYNYLASVLKLCRNKSAALKLAAFVTVMLTST